MNLLWKGGQDKFDLTNKQTIRKLLRAALIGGLIFQVAAIAILCAVPPVSRDALTHHLAIPKLYLERGIATEFPSISFSYFPMNVDLLYMIPLYFNCDIGAKYLHFIFALLTAVLIYRTVRKWVNSTYGLLGAFVFLTLPVIVKLSISVYVDLGLIFFSTAALVALLNWMDDGLRLRHVVVSGICCGLALGTKYNALIVFCILFFCVPLLGLKYSRAIYSKKANNDGVCSAKQTHVWKSVLIFGSVAMLLYSPWLMRNTLWTGNPVYPLYQKFFKSHSLQGNQSRLTENDHDRGLFVSKTKLNHFVLRRLGYKESIWEIATTPVRIFFQGKDDSPKYFDGKLHPFLFFFPFLAFWPIRQDQINVRLGKSFLMGFAWLYLLFAFFSVDMRIRYIAPAIAPLTILTVCGIYNLQLIIEKKLNYKFPNYIYAGIIAFALMAPNLTYLSGLYQKFSPFDYLSNQINRDEYIERYRPGYAVLQYANQFLPDDAKILSVFGGKRRYYSDRDIYFNNGLFESVIVNAKSVTAIRISLLDLGFSHLIVNHQLFEDYAASKFSRDKKEQKNSLFTGGLKLLYQKNGYSLYAL